MNALPTEKAESTRLTNLQRRVKALEEENASLRAQVERLQSLVADMQDLRRKWGKEK